MVKTVATFDAAARFEYLTGFRKRKQQRRENAVDELRAAAKRERTTTREELRLAARDERIVVRLKGGDPFVFGRGGEEAQTLVQHGVPVRIIPGISAGIGGLAYAGIPVTHRDVNQSVTFITGHDQSGETPNTLDWASISRSSQVLVIYMGMKHIGQISAALLAAAPLAAQSTSSAAPAPTLTLAEVRALVDAHLPDHPAIVYGASTLGAVLVVAIGKFLERRQARAAAP